MVTKAKFVDENKKDKKVKGYGIVRMSDNANIELYSKSKGWGSEDITLFKNHDLAEDELESMLNEDNKLMFIIAFG